MLHIDPERLNAQDVVKLKLKQKSPLNKVDREQAHFTPAPPRPATSKHPPLMEQQGAVEALIFGMVQIPVPSDNVRPLKHMPPNAPEHSFLKATPILLGKICLNVKPIWKIRGHPKLPDMAMTLGAVGPFPREPTVLTGLLVHRFNEGVEAELEVKTAAFPRLILAPPQVPESYIKGMCFANNFSLL